MNIFIPIPFVDNFIPTQDTNLKLDYNETKTLQKGTILKFSSYNISKTKKNNSLVSINIFEPGKKAEIGVRVKIVDINKLEGIEKMLTEEELQKEKELKFKDSIGNLNDLV